MFSVLLICLAAIVFVNCISYAVFGNYTFSKSETATKKTSVPISVIVCAKNEAENLRKNVPHILAQSYLNFELILINDASSDETLDIIKSFAEQDSRVKYVDVVNNEAFWANKKYSLTLGIKKAKNNYLLFTDADCRPDSPNWIQEMANHFADRKELILGYGPYESKPSLLNRLIRFETVMTAIQYFSFAKAGSPYMGVGRNLAYTNKLFYDTRGFMSHMNIRSGDDDLFVNEAGTKNNTAICDIPESFVYSEPKKTWKSWMHQKKRHISTASNYKKKHQFLLTTYFLFNVLFWIGLISAYLFLDWKYVTVLVAFRFIMQYVFVGKGILRLREKGLLAILPLLELLLIFFQLRIFIANIFSKPKHWK